MPSRTFTRRRAALLSVAAIAACGQPSRPSPAPKPSTDPQAQWAHSVDQLGAATDADVASTIAGLWAFADAFGPVTARPGRNAVFSPISIGYAFAMLRAGSGGTTARQLDQVFGFPDSVHDAFAVIGRDVVTTGEPPPAKSKMLTVALANALFLQDGLRVRPDFEQILRDSYGAPPRPVDFSSGDATKVIDGWVRQQTRGRIDRLFDQLDRSTIAVLANAVYLKAYWANQFDKALTRDATFLLANGDKVQAPMMRLPKPAALNYAGGRGWQAVELPYRGDELAMWVLVPTEGLRAPRLTPATLAALGDAAPRVVDLELPRWNFGQPIELLPELRKLGLTVLTDLPGFGEGAFVDQAVHRANVTVDESGTEAAAVTGIAVRVSATFAEVKVHADRPFTFAVVHRPTGAPMFLGTVADPTAS